MSLWFYISLVLIGGGVIVIFLAAEKEFDAKDEQWKKRERGLSGTRSPLARPLR
ncbi:MAG: hypothetical protein OD817_04535 [Gammaproteobacteria bacterium]